MEEKKAIKVLIVEDHDASSLGLSLYLRKHKGHPLYLPKQVSSVREALIDVRMGVYDVVLLEYYFKDKITTTPKNGDVFLQQIKTLPRRPKVIMYTKFDGIGVVNYLVNQLYAEGYVLKGKRSLEEIVPAITCVVGGNRYFSPTILKKLKEIELGEVDFIDQQLLKGLIQGCLQKNLTEYLFNHGIALTLSAIEKRISRLKIHFNANTLAELISIVLKEGVV